MKALEFLKELHLDEINTGRNIVELMQITNVQIPKGGVSARYLYFCTYKKDLFINAQPSCVLEFGQSTEQYLYKIDE